MGWGLPRGLGTAGDQGLRARACPGVWGLPGLAAAPALPSAPRAPSRPGRALHVSRAARSGGGGGAGRQGRAGAAPRPGPEREPQRSGCGGRGGGRGPAKMANVGLQFQASAGDADPQSRPVLLLGQLHHLHRVPWSHVRGKLQPRVTEEVSGPRRRHAPPRWRAEDGRGRAGGEAAEAPPRPPEPPARRRRGAQGQAGLLGPGRPPPHRQQSRPPPAPGPSSWESWQL